MKISKETEMLINSMEKAAGRIVGEYERARRAADYWFDKEQEEIENGRFENAKEARFRAEQQMTFSRGIACALAALGFEPAVYRFGGKIDRVVLTKL